MTSAELRQSFLDFFAAHQHTIVPSASLLPDSPGLLFTNAGMNQFVPIFLGDRTPDVATWAGTLPAASTRAADTQKCIRAGGKHNDLEDVGYDTYHHTLFEMLGNWSFGDYFKTESLTWGWDLLTRVWGIPPKRLFATIYQPAPGDPATRYTEAYAVWSTLFTAAGLDPAVHIVNGNKKDNFWMMGDTGPCGPCSEIHCNLNPSDDEAAGRDLVNSSSPRCIEIWNHVFIQFNANADGTFSSLAAQHVDTGMGFERVAGIMATTQNFTDFTAEPSNYEADVFAPLFATITELSGKTYTKTVPKQREGLTDQEQTDIAFRVLADHARTISCAIADDILPGNEGRNYVIRRILRRGILYGKKLGLDTGFFEKLVPPVVASLGSVFPELAERQDLIRRVIRSEEESFGRTLDRGLAEFEQSISDASAYDSKIFGGNHAFKLYDTFGFPLDMTQLLAAERGLTVDTAGFEELMDQQRARARAAQKKEIVVAATAEDAPADLAPTTFVGYDNLTAEATLLDVVTTADATWVVFDRTPFYAEMGGQAGDTGTIALADTTLTVTYTVKDKSGRFLHRVASEADLNSQISNLKPGSPATLRVAAERRRAISRHHSAAHLIHWALRQIVGTHVRQAGTSKTPERMRFDFSHFEALTPAQLTEIEKLINAQVIDNAPVRTYETDFDKKPAGTLAFFGEKYGSRVRVVDMGGYSLELCGGTHVATTGEIGLIKLVSEGGVAAGTRRIEAVAGAPAYDLVAAHEAALTAVATRLHGGPADVAEKLDTLLTQKAELEKKLKAFEQRAAAGLADDLVARAVERDGLSRVSAVVTTVEDPSALRALGASVLAKLGEGVVTLGAAFGEKTAIVAFCSPAAIAAGHQAGKLVATLSAQLGGKGGGKPDFAMGGGKSPEKLPEVLSV